MFKLLFYQNYTLFCYFTLSSRGIHGCPFQLQMNIPALFVNKLCYTYGTSEQVERGEGAGGHRKRLARKENVSKPIPFIRLQDQDIRMYQFPVPFILVVSQQTRGKLTHYKQCLACRDPALIPTTYFVSTAASLPTNKQLLQQ